MKNQWDEFLVFPLRALFIGKKGVVYEKIYETTGVFRFIHHPSSPRSMENGIALPYNSLQWWDTCRILSSAFEGCSPSFPVIFSLRQNYDLSWRQNTSPRVISHYSIFDVR